MNPIVKKEYLDNFNKVRSTTSRALIVNPSQIENEYTVYYGMKIWRPCITNSPIMGFLSLVKFITEYSPKYFIIDGLSSVDDIFKKLLKYFDITILHFTVPDSLSWESQDVNFPFEKKYYAYKEKVDEIIIKDAIAKESLFYTFASRKDAFGCSEILDGLAGYYLKVKSQNFKHWIVPIDIILDQYCNKSYVMTPNIDKCIRKGFDVMKIFKDEGRFVFLSGKLYIPPFRYRLDTQIFITGGIRDKLIEYDAEKLSRKINYFNTFTRQFQPQINPAADPSFGFDHCHDCAHEYVIWSDYFDRHLKGSKSTKNTYIIKAVKSTHNSELRNESHGYLFDNSDKTILKMFMKSAFDRVEARNTK
jgi:hypothetical protein